MFAVATLFARRGEALFRALGEGNLFAWGFVVIAVIGLILKFKDAAAAKNAVPVVSSVAGSQGRTCPHCSASVRPDASFCRHCKQWLK